MFRFSSFTAFILILVQFLVGVTAHAESFSFQSPNKDDSSFVIDTLDEWKNSISEMLNIASAQSDLDLLNLAEYIRSDLILDINAHLQTSIVSKNGRIEAMATTSQMPILGANCLFISTLMSRPGNLLLSSVPTDRVSGAATELMRERFREAIVLGSDKCMFLEAVPSAVTFYEHIGMRKTGMLNPNKHNIMLMNEEAADLFLQRAVGN